MKNDALFLKVMIGLFIILILYGAGMTMVIIYGDHVIATRLISGFASMFAGILGLAAGYILGRTNGNGH